MTEFAYSFEANQNPLNEAGRAQILADPGFGDYFTDHMFQADWTLDGGWSDARVVPYGPLQLDPATAVLHYGQEIFEGLKAYGWADGSVWAFRPDANAARFQRSAERLALPQLPIEWFVGSVKALVEADKSWVPSGEERSLYLRPFMFASEKFLGVRPSHDVLYSVIASPAGSYFASGVAPVDIWLSTRYTRAGVGGTGAAKCGGNYAASLVAQAEAYDNGCSQVAFLDSVEQRWIEELGGMNLFFVMANGEVVTPSLSGSILEGVTRDSIMVLAKELGHDVTERQISIDEWRKGADDGTIAEVFACGTAAVITPVDTLKWDGGQVQVGDGAAGEATMSIRKALVDIQSGHSEDRHGWMTRLA